MVTPPGPWTTVLVDHLFVISVLVLLCFCARLTSVYWCLVVICWERADLLALVYDV